jgi:hypothetical protein
MPAQPAKTHTGDPGAAAVRLQQQTIHTRIMVLVKAKQLQAATGG